ncbi:MAG: single-stranded DNA-binding protein [Roseiflexaceae bacterium]|nr:single-stranded DNA-binding protein [Roseiflexaceae bacterium]
MAKDLNKVMLTGHLGADPEMRYTPQGSAVTTFRVASGRTWKSADGTQHDDTEWFSVVSWDKLAEICNQYLTKGTRVYIEGRLQTRSWDDKTSGEKRYKTEVIAQDMIILSSRGDRPAGSEFEAPAPDEEPAPPPMASTTARRPATAPAPSAAAPRDNGGAPSRPAATGRPAPRNLPQAIEGDEDLPF